MAERDLALPSVLGWDLEPAVDLEREMALAPEVLEQGGQVMALQASVQASVLASAYRHNQTV